MTPRRDIQRNGEPAVVSLPIPRIATGASQPMPPLRVQLRAMLKRWVRRLGKNQGKVVAVFGRSQASCYDAVRYVRQEIPEIPVWLFSTEDPGADTAALCHRITTEPNQIRMAVEAQRVLWPQSVALVLVTWTGEPGGFFRLGPLLIPPFRSLIMNENRGFFRATPQTVSLHAWLRGREFLRSGWRRSIDLAAGVRHLCAATARRALCETRYFLRRSLGRLRSEVRDPIHSGWRRLQDLSMAVALALLALPLRTFRSFIRDRLYQRRAGGARPSVPFPHQETGVVRLEYDRTGFEVTNLLRAARSSSARWLLWIESGADGDYRDMLSLFDDRHTFAVSRQAGFQDAGSALLPRAPIRRLQAGEACRVLAPISPCILFDREKLCALDLDATSLNGTGLLLLFWRAAALGFRSYSLAANGRCERLPDWPVQEAEFASRVLLEQKLRELRPRELDLSRGDIAFTPAGPQPPAQKLRVLVVSPYSPYPLSHGGAVRIYNLCSALSHRVDFVLAMYREAREQVDYAKLQEVFAEVYVVDKRHDEPGDRRHPSQVRDFPTGSMSALVSQLCREKRFDLLQLEYTHLALLRDAAPEVPAILVAHDLTFSLQEQVAQLSDRWGGQQEYNRWLSFERKALPRFEQVWTMSEDDRCAAVREGGRPDAAVVVPNGVDADWFEPQPEPAADPEVLFVGSFRHLPNVLAFDRLRSRVMPRIWRSLPNVRLRVVAGKDPGPYWRSYAGSCALQFDPRVAVHEFVADLRPLYQRAWVVLAPLIVSAGTNIKVIEAMACRRAVVATAVGARGLGLTDGHDVVIRSAEDQLAEATVLLLTDHQLRKEIACNARRTVEQRFTWSHCAKLAYHSYGSLAGVSQAVVAGGSTCYAEA